MTTRKVYLGLLDIGLDSKIELQIPKGEQRNWYITSYLFSYGLMADQVVIQGSAPLKDTGISYATKKLLDAFRRNEHYEPKPIFLPPLNEECQGYVEYLSNRVNYLEKGNSQNQEIDAYKKNNAISSAKFLDKELDTNIPRRKGSVSKIFLSSLHRLVTSDTLLRNIIPDRSIQFAEKYLKNSETIQTFEFIRSMKIEDANALNKAYEIVRQKYKNSNAAVSDAIDSESIHIWSFSSIKFFLHSIGLDIVFNSNHNLSSELLFKIRLLESFKSIKDEYFHCQSAQESYFLATMCREIRTNSRIQKIMTQSPAAALAMIIETVNQAEIGYKPINKGIETALKSFLVNEAEMYYSKKHYRIAKIIEELRSELLLLLPK